MSDVSGAVDAPVAEQASEAPTSDAAPKTIAEATKGSAAAPARPAQAPWSKDLEDLGLDPETLSKVDQYMREKIQPRTTQLEQKASEYDKLFSKFTMQDGSPLAANDAAMMASELLDALATDPENAVRDIMQLMSLDPAKFAQVQQEMSDQQQETTKETTPQNEEVPPELEWIQEKMRMEQEAAQDKAWEDHLAEREAEIPGFNRDLYTMAMAAVGPDPEVVMDWYNKFHVAPAPTPQAPPTVSPGQPTPPETPYYGSIKDAVRGYIADQKVANQG